MIGTKALGTSALGVPAAEQAQSGVSVGTSAGSSAAAGQGLALFRAGGASSGAGAGVASGRSLARGNGASAGSAVGAAVGGSTGGSGGMPTGFASGTSDVVGQGRSLRRGNGAAPGSSTALATGNFYTPSTIRLDIQKLAPGQLVEMFELDISTITGTDTPEDHYYFHAGTAADFSSITWQTKVYNRFPISGEGFDKSTRGTLPRPRLTVANVTGIVTALLLVTDDLVGARVVRRRTYAKYLDGQLGADPNQHLPDDVFFIERKISETNMAVEFELASAMDFEGMLLPSRPIAANVCPWDYRSTECSYTGTTYFNVLDLPVTSLVEDVCSKSVVGCKRRFGATGLLPFGGFPAARTYKV